jgi:hypothetical protein
MVKYPASIGKLGLQMRHKNKRELNDYIFVYYYIKYIYILHITLRPGGKNQHTPKLSTITEYPNHHESVYYKRWQISFLIFFVGPYLRARNTAGAFQGTPQALKMCGRCKKARHVMFHRNQSLVVRFIML